MESNIVVILFDEPGKAELAYEGLEKLENEGKIAIDDAVIASREPEGERTLLPSEQTGTFTSATPQPGTEDLGATQVKITQTHSEKRKRVAAGGGVGLLAGVLLGGPIGGLVVGASLGALSEHMRDKGLDEESVHEIADHRQADTSALFLLAHDADQDAVLEHVSLYKAKLVKTTLPDDKAEALREALAKEA
jgi:uncharacterized membrane protein